MSRPSSFLKLDRLEYSKMSSSVIFEYSCRSNRICWCSSVSVTDIFVYIGHVAHAHAHLRRRRRKNLQLFRNAINRDVLFVFDIQTDTRFEFRNTNTHIFNYTYIEPETDDQAIIPTAKPNSWIIASNFRYHFFLSLFLLCQCWYGVSLEGMWFSPVCPVCFMQIHRIRLL